MKKFKISKPIRLVELFAGIGAQSKALEDLGVPFEHYKICEFDKYAVNSYNAIHHTNYDPSDITKITAKDLNIIDTEHYDYIMTYSFPCITKDSLILTKKGYIKMEDVTVNDYVLTKSNTWQKVYKKFDNGRHQTYYLQGMGFENIHCTDNHKFWVRTMYRKGHKPIRCFTEPQFKEVKDITTKDYFGMPIIKEEISFYTDDLDFWYMLGIFLGDGWLPKKGNDIIIACNEKKLEKIKAVLPKEKWNYTYSWNGTCYRLRFSNKEISNFIKEYIGTGCEEKHIAYEIMCLPKEQLQMFYNGYLDSDGSIVKGKHQFSSINRNLIYSISCIINKLYNRPTSIYKIKTSPSKEIQGRKINQKDWYQLRFNPITNKQDKAFYEDGYIWYPFTKLEKAEIENVYNMEIENDHSYIIQGCISKNCQDLSNAGKQAGMTKGSGTRSGLLWEVERLLNETKELPQVLVMENVPLVHGKKNIKDFNKWLEFLRSKGYHNFYQDLNAKDFGIPQNRNRCFMVSILGDYDYQFPTGRDLNLRLCDILEDEKEMDESYYLKNKTFEAISKNINNQTDKIIQVGNVNIGNNESNNRVYSAEGICPTLNTMQGGHRQPKIITLGNTTKSKHSAGRIVDTYGLAPTVMENHGTVTKVLIPEIDGKIYQRPHGFNKGKILNECPSITSSSFQENNYIIVDQDIKPSVATNYEREKEAIAHTDKDIYQCKCTSGWQDNKVGVKVSPTLRAGNPHTAIYHNYRIRKLTPKECWRLMGFSDEDFNNASKVNSKTQLYKQAGNSIVVNVLKAIFKELL